MAKMSDYCIVFFKGSRGSASLIAESLKQNVPVCIVSISEKVGIDKVIYVNNSNDWEKVELEFASA